MRTTTIKTVTACAAVFVALLVGSIAGPAAVKAITTGGPVNTASFDPGVTNKLNAVLEELSNAGVGRPGR